ncbi:tRNA 2-thiouridine(34) synthase MnmA [Candidatus Omnitrophota bacterium]
MKKRVLVAMSGGVDSSVAAYLLKKDGFKVAGVTMCLGVKETGKEKPACCGPEAINDAKKVCRKLKIPHYVMDFSKQLEEEVIDKFITEYLSGRTPNPCVDCNRALKFGTLLEKALAMEFDFLATGHYAKLVSSRILSAGKGKKVFLLKRAKDRKKDQSYFLYAVKRDVLKSILFPLADLTKDEVRAIAKKASLPVAEKKESQDICFVAGGDRRKFFSERTEGTTKRGPIVTLEGNLLGEHNGAAFYTIGQRKGLGVGHRHPLYVLSADAEENKLVVGKKEDLTSHGLLAEKANLLVDELPRKAFVKIRYNQKKAKCTVFPRRNGESFELVFEEPQEAVTPGQSAVLYNGDVVLGGGVIEKVIRR